MFSVADAVRDVNMSTATITAGVQLQMQPNSELATKTKLAEALPLLPGRVLALVAAYFEGRSDETRRQVAKMVKLRRKDRGYGTMAYIKTHVAGVVEDKQGKVAQGKRRQACKTPCDCCFACDHCPKKYVVKGSLTTHQKTHAAAGNGSAQPAAPSSVAGVPSVAFASVVNKQRAGHASDDELDAGQEQAEQKAKLSDDELDEGQEQADQDKPLCVCGAVYDNDRYMLNCDGCDNWYHLPCLVQEWGMIIYEFEADALGEWYCGKDGCKEQGMLTLAEVQEWDGRVTDMKVEDKKMLYLVDFVGDFDPVWAPESHIPHPRLLEFRQAREAQAKAGADEAKAAAKIAKKVKAPDKTKKAKEMKVCMVCVCV